MYKNVIAVGDSFLEGAELTENLPDTQYVAAALLATHHGCDFYNLAQSGAGTLAVVEQLKLAELGGILNKDSLIVYSIPPAGRIDFALTDSDKYFTLDYWFQKSIYDGKTFEGMPDNEFVRANQDRFKRLYDAMSDVDWIKFSEQLHYGGICAMVNILNKYTSVGFIGHPQHLLDQYYRRQTLDALSKLDRLLFIDNGFTGWSKANKYTIMPAGHPGADAHRALVELLL
jgi:hypothetical protein